MIMFLEHYWGFAGALVLGFLQKTQVFRQNNPACRPLPTGLAVDTPYLSSTFLNIPNQHYRCALTQYRLNLHNLGIETGRHTKPPTPQEKRLCLYSNNGFVDDEISLQTVQPTQTYPIG